MSENSTVPTLLPHHEQQALCSTRLPYRQGRKLTAVKIDVICTSDGQWVVLGAANMQLLLKYVAYTVNNESRHLLVFGVPALNLRQETKALFTRFGKLQLNITKYQTEQFTETYHAIFEDIQSARIAKKMLDTKNYYGGHLHICYAPEEETVNDTRTKLLLRRKNVVARLKNLQKPVIESCVIKPEYTEHKIDENKIVDETLYMGNENNIGYGKRKSDFKSVKHCKLKKSRNFDRTTCVAVTKNDFAHPCDENIETVKVMDNSPKNVCEIFDFTSVETDILTNINETLNYDNFGKELIRQVPYKPVNKIKFSFNKNT